MVVPVLMTVNAQTNAVLIQYAIPFLTRIAKNQSRGWMIMTAKKTFNASLNAAPTSSASTLPQTPANNNSPATGFQWLS